MSEREKGERATGTPNTIYDLSSVLFHALEGGASYDRYVRDAEEAGDRELIKFFKQMRDEDSRRADEAQRLLAQRITGVVPNENTTAPNVGSTAGTRRRREETTRAPEGRHDPTAATNTPISGPGQRGPDVPPVRPQEPPPPGTGIAER